MTPDECPHGYPGAERLRCLECVKQRIAALEQELEQAKEREGQSQSKMTELDADFSHEFDERSKLLKENRRLREALTQIIACLEPSESSLGMKARKIAEAALTVSPAQEKP